MVKIISHSPRHTDINDLYYFSTSKYDGEIEIMKRSYTVLSFSSFCLKTKVFLRNKRQLFLKFYKCAKIRLRGLHKTAVAREVNLTKFVKYLIKKDISLTSLLMKKDVF